MMTAIVVIASIIVVWLAAGPNEAWTEILLKTGATAAILLILPIVYLWELFRAKDWVQRQRRMLTVVAGIVIVVAGLGVIALGLTNKPTPAAANNLSQNIETFLAKRGKDADLNAIRPLIQMEDQADGKGPYIARWDASLGPWPTVTDGFTTHQLHRLPKHIPQLKTQTARENFNQAVDSLSNILNKQISKVVSQSQSLAGHSPLVGKGRESATDRLQQIADIQSQSGTIAKALFDGDETIFKASSYGQDLSGILPDQPREQWSRFELAIHDFAQALRLIQDAERYPEDNRLYTNAVNNLKTYQTSLAKHWETF